MCYIKKLVLFSFVFTTLLFQSCNKRAHVENTSPNVLFIAVDAQIGKVLDQLDKSPYADNTLIVFWSDHGWHLGEKEHWGKQTVWKNSTRVPMIIVPPKNSKIQKNQKRNNPVNLLDIYPTLVEICNLPKHKKLEGNSLYPLVVKQDAKIENVSITTMGRGTNSIRTKKWRYIQYFDGSEELYDVVKDPNEWVNLSKNEKYNKINKKLNSYVVEDKRIKRYARMGNWKIVEEEDGNILLFDLRTPPRLTETTDVSSNQSDLVDKIRKT